VSEGSFIKVVKEICARDPRYEPDAYMFVVESLDYTAKALNKPTREGPERHVTGRELCDGIKAYAIQEFGPMALTVLKTWGITRTEDFGEIVFNLVESGKLRRTEQDTREDFAKGYDFYEAFAVPFLPRSKRTGGHGTASQSGRSATWSRRRRTRPRPRRMA
jgi:uncharacterized repeat protein (TIGR04138 family)